MTDAEGRSPEGGRSSMEGWRRLVEDSLKGGDLSALNSLTRDGIVVEPLYTRRRVGAPLPGRGARPWSVVQIVDAPDPDDANAQALADVKGGATGLSVRFAGSPSAAGHGLPAAPQALRIALEEVDLTQLYLRVEPHADALSSAVWLREIVETSGIAPELTSISFGLDPAVSAVSDGASVTPDAEAFAACVRALTAASFRGPLATLDGRLYHEAGATEAQELAGILAAAAWWLRALDEAGLGPSESLPLLGASVATDRDELLSIAKLRALRLAWSRLEELCGTEPSPLTVHAETSRRMLTCADPSTNLLRTTLAAFAAAVGGANAITVQPHTAALGIADGSARARARNIQHLLMEEAHLYRVADPGAGSGAIEALTDALAERAWAEFQAIEREGGIVASLNTNAFQARIAEARAALKDDVADGRAPLVGATIYPAPEEVPPHPAAQHDGTLAAHGLAPVRLEDLAGATA